MQSSYTTNISAKLTVQGNNVSIRNYPQRGTIVRSVNSGAIIQATKRAQISGDPWFYTNNGWISGKYIQGWIKDANDNNRWWYVRSGYSYPTGKWENIGGKDYCFGKDSYLFVYCYIRAADKRNYYWVDDDGVWQQQYTTTTPNRSKYRVVENYAGTNAYTGGNILQADKIYCGNMALTETQMKVNAQYILNYLRGKGWTKNAVCGMLGNMEKESYINPGYWQDMKAEHTSLGFGLTQWTPSTKYFKWATKNNLYHIDMDSQLKRILYEVNATGDDAQYIIKNGYNITFQAFTKSAESPYYLAQVILHNYERPENPNQDADRGDAAIRWYNVLN